jgi:nuclear pore complex protein Nup188
VDNFRVSLAGPQLKEVLRRVNGGSDAGFSTEKSRRKRLQNIYLDERSHILKTSRKLLGLSLHDTVPADAGVVPRPDTLPGAAVNDKLSSLGEQLFDGKKGETESSRFLLGAIKGIQKRLSDFQSEGGWLSISESDMETDASWRTTLIDETVHTIQIILLHVQSLRTIPSGDVVLAWLKLMVEFNFMEPITPVSTIRTPDHYLL